MRPAKLFLATLLAASAALQLAGCASFDEPVAPVAAEDTSLAARVKAAITDAAGSGTAMNVNVVAEGGGTVRLTGFAESRYASLRAEQIARATDGVRFVRNELNVPPRPDDPSFSQEMRRP